MSEPSLIDRVYEWLNDVRVYPYRLTLAISDLRNFQISTLRGVWGSALRKLDVPTYRKVFEGSGSKQLATPRYIIRPTSLEASTNDSTLDVDFIFWGTNDEERGFLEKAWNDAAHMGLGRERKPFPIRKIDYLYLPVPKEGLSMAQLARALSIAGRPYAARFETPVRILERERLIDEPTFEELIKRVMTRLATIRLQSTNAFERADEGRPAELRPEFYGEALELARNVRVSQWSGSKSAFRRYSGRQRVEVEMLGAIGGWELYDDLGALRPLVDSAIVLGVGKGTTMGLGRLTLDYD